MINENLEWGHCDTNQFAIQWQEFDRNDYIVTKEKSFKTRKAMENFIAKLEQKNNFYQIVAYAF